MNHLSSFAKLIFESSAFVLLLFICTAEKVCLSFQPDGANINSSQVSNKNSDLILTSWGSPPREKLAWQNLCIYIKYYTLEEGETPVFGGAGEEREAKARLIIAFLSCYQDPLRSTPATTTPHVMLSQGQFQQPFISLPIFLSPYTFSPSTDSSALGWLLPVSALARHLCLAGLWFPWFPQGKKGTYNPS